MSKWDGFDSAVRRLGKDLGFRQIRVYTSESTYDPDTGKYTQEYTEHAESPLSAELRQPNQPQLSRDSDGTEVNVDVTVFVDSDIPIEWVGADENPDWPHKIGDVDSGSEYRIYEPFDQGNGLVKLYGVKTGTVDRDADGESTTLETTFESAFIG